MKEYAYYKNGTLHDTVIHVSLKEATNYFENMHGKACHVCLHKTKKDLFIEKFIITLRINNNNRELLLDKLTGLLDTISLKTLKEFLE